MQENVRKHVKKAEEKRKIRRRTKILLGICSVLVAVGVVWGLILPGLAATGNNEDPAENTTISERINLNVSQKSEDDGKNGQILYATVSVTNSNPTDKELVPVRVLISDLPEGVTLTGFEESNIMQVTYKASSSTTEETLEVELKEENGQKYIEFYPPAGSTVSFDLQFNSANGIMERESKVTLTPQIPDQMDNDVLSDPAELVWTGKNIWQNLNKTVSKTIIPVNGKENRLEGTLDYQITAENSNPCGTGDTGAIWTDHVELNDVLTLPEGISFPEGTRVSDDGTTIVDKDGNVIFSFTYLQGGSVESLVLDGKTVTYKLNIPNKYMVDGIPSREQDHLNVSASLDVSKLVLADNYITTSASKVADDIIKNHVDFEAFPYKEYEHSKASAEVTSRPEIKEGFKVTKTADCAEVRAGDTINYTISIENTGNNPIKGQASDGSVYYVKDKLSEYLELTAEQIQALKSKGASYDERTRTISWAPGTLQPGDKAEFTFAVNVKQLKDIPSLEDGAAINNSATYKDQTDNVTVKYKKPKLTITKVAVEWDGQTVSDVKNCKNGDLVTYQIMVKNDEDMETLEETITDVLDNALEFQYVMDKNGKPVMNSGETFPAMSIFENDRYGTHFTGLRVDGQKLTFSLGRLAPKEGVLITLVCKVNTDKFPDNSNWHIKNTAKSITTGEKSGESDIEVEKPITIDKKVDGTDGGGTYKAGETLDYSITIKNADGDAASQKDNLFLTDKMPYHVFPSDEYVIYKPAVNGTLTNVYPKDDSELQEAGISWKEYSDNSGDWGTYYTKINGEYVRIRRSWVGDENGIHVRANAAIVLIWNVGKMQPGESLTKEFKASIYMDDAENEKTGKLSYKNEATIDKISDSVTVYGEPEGKKEYDYAADIRKSVWCILDQENGDYWTARQLKDKSIFSKSVNKGNYFGNYVTYNITIANTGSDPLHLDTLEDHMAANLQYVGINSNTCRGVPKDFEKTEILSNNWNVAGETSLDGHQLMLNVKIQQIKLDPDTNTVTYQIGDGDGYDLPAGKQISFFVMCKVSEDAELDVPLTNTANLIVDKEVQYRKYDKEITMRGTRDDSRQNNGTSEDLGVTGDKRTISSSVTVTPRDVIVPGIEKKAISYIPSGKGVQDSVPLEEKDNIQPNVTTKWNLTLRNDGTVPISGYTIKDSVQAPFHILSKSEAESDKLELGLEKNAFVLTIYNDYDSQIASYDLSEEVWKLIPDNKTNSFELHLEDEKYNIPAGGKAEFTVYTRNTTYDNKIYENTAYLLPDNPFDANSVRTGELVTDDGGKYIGVKASDCVYALGDYGSFSWKTIEETGNSENRGSGYLGLEGKNYIYLDEDGKDVIYTNNIENVSNNSFVDMVIVDCMPHVNDTGVLNQDEKRESEFKVNYADGLNLYVVNESGSKTMLNSGTDYTVEFSQTASFTEADMAGTSLEGWHDQWQTDDMSFRIRMADTFKLKKGCILTIQYNGRLGDDASAGETAWNSFAYQYTATVNGHEKTLRAEPPKVGVKIYKKPVIEKDVLDAYGNELPYDQTKTFTFALYKGDSTDESDYITEFSVCQGGSVALKSITDQNGNKAFEDGQVYTVKEKLVNGYELVGIGQKGTELSKENKYTFTYYDNLDSISIQVKNQEYGYELPATGGTGTTVYTIGGAAIMLAASLLYGYRMRRKREKGAGI